jgi:V-type H+-transporting ATPase subunit G
MPHSASTANNAQPQAYVKELIESEKKATKIMDDARKKKTNKLKKAKDEAQLDVENIRKECENSFNERIRNHALKQDKSIEEYEKKFKTESVHLTNYYRKNNEDTLEFILSLFVHIKPELHKNFKF